MANKLILYLPKNSIICCINYQCACVFSFQAWQLQQVGKPHHSRKAELARGCWRKQPFSWPWSLEDLSRDWKSPLKIGKQNYPELVDERSKAFFEAVVSFFNVWRGETKQEIIPMCIYVICKLVSC